MAKEVRGKTITFEDVKKEVSRIATKQCEETEKYIKGDHWQEGDGWIGWRPDPLKVTPSSTEQWKYVESSFTAKNVIGGLVKRLKGAILGKEPDWNILPQSKETEIEEVPDPLEKPKPPTPEEQAYMKIDEQLVDWWIKKKVHGVIKEALANKAAYGKLGLRIYIPDGYIEEFETKDGIKNYKLIGDTSFESVLDKIFVEAIHYSNFIDAKDESFGNKFYIVRLPKRDESETERYEIYFTDTENKTHIRQINESGEISEATIDLAGNNLCYVEGEYEDALISPTVKTQQKSVNHAKTGANYCLANINYPETTFINAAIKQDEVIGEGGKLTLVDRPMSQGFGYFRNLLGIKTQMDNGEKRETPQIHQRQPADPKKFVEIASDATRDMHQEVGMLYVFLGDSEYASGDARVEAMTDYIILLLDHKTIMDTLGVWLFTTVIRFAFSFSGQTTKNRDFKVHFSTKMNVGKVSTADKELMLQEVAAKVRSERSYIITAEVNDDPTLELKAIKAQEASKPKDELGNVIDADHPAQPKIEQPPKTDKATA